MKGITVCEGFVYILFSVGLAQTGGISYFIKLVVDQISYSKLFKHLVPY